MYEDLDDEINLIIDNAKSAINEIDRHNYNKYFIYAEEFCAKNGILIGGRNGINILSAAPHKAVIDKDSYFYELYADDTLNQARALATLLFDKTADYTISLKTVAKHKEFTIYVNTRPLFTLKAFGRYKGVAISDLIIPVNGQGLFTGKNMHILSGELYLIHIYRMLYLPYADKVGGYTSYTEWLDLERNIFNIAIDDLEKKIVGELSGGAPVDSGISLADLSNNIIETLDNNYLIVGDFALPDDILKKHKLRPRLQLITGQPPDSATYLIKKAIKGRPVIYEAHDLNLPDDFQIKKYIFYIKDNSGTNVPLVEVFNSAAFELVPFVSGTHWAAPFVIMRFRFIDLWTLKLIYNLGNKAQYIRSRVREIITDIVAIRAIIQTIEPGDLFQLDNFIGQYTNEQVEKKKKFNSDVKFYKIIYPKLLK